MDRSFLVLFFKKERAFLMLAFFTSGHVVDVILVLTAIEAIILVTLNRAGLLFHLAAGVCLLIALRLALVGAWYGWIGVALLGSFVAHLLALTMQSSGTSRRSPRRR